MFAKFFKSRLKEASTYRGLLVILGIFGVSFNPEQADAIVGGCLATYGILAAFLPDKFGEKKEAVPAPEPVQAAEPDALVVNGQPVGEKWDGKVPGQFK